MLGANKYLILKRLQRKLRPYESHFPVVIGTVLEITKIMSKWLSHSNFNNFPYRCLISSKSNHFVRRGLFNEAHRKGQQVILKST